MDYSQLIEKRKGRFRELEEAVGDPNLFDNPKRATEILREHRKLQQTLELWDTLQSTETQLSENQELARSDDPELAEMAAIEIPELEASLTKLREDMQYALLPADPNEDRDALVEIRAGAGGDEASLFAAEIMRAYQRYADAKGWKFEHLESSPSEVGGFKEVILKITGDEVFRHLKYESGVHRVQRVPATETQGRIHTSTITVAVLPEAEEVDVDMKMEDLRIEVCRSGGAGGQHVNTTDSAVQIFHLPTGLYVRCEHGRSQIKNKEMALQIMRSRLYEKKTAGAAGRLLGEPPLPHRLRRPLGKDPHLQLPSKPLHRSPHRLHLPQPRRHHVRRPQRGHSRADETRNGRTARRGGDVIWSAAFQAAF